MINLWFYFILLGFIQWLSIIISWLIWDQDSAFALIGKQSWVSFVYQVLKDWRNNKYWAETAEYHYPEKHENKKIYMKSDDKIGKKYWKTFRDKKCIEIIL